MIYKKKNRKEISLSCRLIAFYSVKSMKIENILVFDFKWEKTYCLLFFLFFRFVYIRFTNL